MAYDDQENPPVNIVSPDEFNIDPTTTRVAPAEYGGMLAQGLANWYGANVVPAAQSVRDYWHQAMLPGGDQVEPPPEDHPLNKPAPESVPLIQAIDTGYADKKLMGPLELIRKGVVENDHDSIEKGRKKIVDALTSGMSPIDKFLDTYAHGGLIWGAQKMAADVVMHELMRPHARGAVEAGLIHPSELSPDMQTQPTYSNLIPQEPFQMGYTDMQAGIPAEPMSSVQQSMVPAQPGQEPSGFDINPDVRLTPEQSDLYAARLQAMQHAQRGGEPKAERAPTPSDIAMLGIRTAIAAKEKELGRPLTDAEKVPFIERGQGLLIKEMDAQSKADFRKEQIKLLTSTGNMREAYGLRARMDAEQLIPARAYALNRLGDLREVQMELMDAQKDWYKQLPALKRELAGAPSFETEAIKRVHEAISKKTPIDKGDWLIVERWLRKGSPRFTMDFMGRAFDRLAGQKAEAGKPFGWLGLPEPPSTTFDETATNAFQESDNDLITRFLEFLGSLFGGGSEKPAEKPATETIPTPKTPAEAQKLKPGTKYKTPDGKVMVR